MNDNLHCSFFLRIAYKSAGGGYPIVSLLNNRHGAAVRITKAEFENHSPESAKTLLCIGFQPFIIRKQSRGISVRKGIQLVSVEVDEYPYRGNLVYVIAEGYDDHIVMIPDCIDTHIPQRSEHFIRLKLFEMGIPFTKLLFHLSDQIIHAVHPPVFKYCVFQYLYYTLQMMLCQAVSG
jgi:hypothetical protein